MSEQITISRATAEKALSSIKETAGDVYQTIQESTAIAELETALKERE